jgi:multiple antibiotic resistance protein
MDFIQTTALLFIVFDCIGNLPLFLALLQNLDPKSYRRVLIRESLISLALLTLFLATGDLVFAWLGIEPASLGIAGGILLFLIALRMIFNRPEAIFESHGAGDPLVVPIAVPSIVGPSAITTVLLLRSRYPDQALEIFASLATATFLSLLVYLAGRKLALHLGHRFLDALQKLMGLLLSIIAVNMAIRSIRQIILQIP